VQLIDELLPVVAGAPNLGGHNRSGESIKATKAKQKMQQTQPGSDAASAAALARRAGSYSGNVAQVPNAGALQTSMGLPQGAAWDQAPLLVRVRLPFCLHLLSSACLWMCQSKYHNSEHNQHTGQCSVRFRSGPFLVPFANKMSHFVYYLCVCSMLPCVCVSDASMCVVFSDCCAPCFKLHCDVLFAWHHTCLVVPSQGVFMFWCIKLPALLVFLWNSM